MDRRSRDISIQFSPEETVKSLLLMAAMFVAHPLFGQEVKHAPTVDQCQADVRLWANDRVENEYLDAEDLKSKSGTNNRSNN
jgi:hypothetical protein